MEQFVNPFGNLDNSTATPVVSFSRQEQQSIKELALQRSNGSRGNGLVDKRASKSMSSEVIDQVGLAAELAAALYFGLPVRVSDKPDPGVDLILSTGHKIDVKGTTNLDNPTMWFRKPCRADAGLLVTVDRATFECRLVGWILAPGQYTSHRELRPVSELLSMHEMRRDAAVTGLDDN